MKCKILHETTGRLRVHLCCGRMTLSQEDVLEYYLRARDGVQEVRVYDRTQDAVVVYGGKREDIISALAQFSFAEAEAMELVPEHTSRALNREFEDKLAVTASAVAGSLTNTIFYLGLMLLFYVIMGINSEKVLTLIGGTGLIAGSLEAVANALITTPVVLALRKMKH